MCVKLVPIRPEGDAATVAGPAPVERAHVAFANAPGTLTAGTWEASPHVEVIEGSPVDGLMVIVPGSVAITDAEGTAQTFGPGETFAMPLGFKGRGENTEPAKNYFMILEWQRPQGRRPRM